MFIETEQTPNPATLKFLPGQAVLEEGTANFTSAEAAEVSPLAVRLFQLPEVSGVFLGSDFVTVTKGEGDWAALKAEILGIIMDHYVSGQPMLTGRLPESTSAAGAEEDEEIIAQIKELLDTRVRPAVAQDGGDITFHGFEGGIVYLHMQGACSGCPSSSMTLKHGIENLLKHFVPEVTAVEAV
jgi:Fe-S cluster biogenesis protein NfuA